MPACDPTDDSVSTNWQRLATMWGRATRRRTGSSIPYHNGVMASKSCQHPASHRDSISNSQLTALSRRPGRNPARAGPGPQGQKDCAAHGAAWLTPTPPGRLRVGVDSNWPHIRWPRPRQLQSVGGRPSRYTTRMPVARSGPGRGRGTPGHGRPAAGPIGSVTVPRLFQCHADSTASPTQLRP